MLFEPFDEMSWHTKVLSISVLEYFVVSCLQPSLYVDKGLWVTFKVFFTENMKRNIWCDHWSGIFCLVQFWNLFVPQSSCRLYRSGYYPVVHDIGPFFARSLLRVRSFAIIIICLVVLCINSEMCQTMLCDPLYKMPWRKFCCILSPAKSISRKGQWDKLKVFSAENVGKQSLMKPFISSYI